MKHDSTADRTSISSSASHRRVQRSTTLNRKYVKKPVKVVASESAAKRRTDDLKRRQALAEKINHDRIAALKSSKSLQKSAASPKLSSSSSSSSVQINRKSSSSSSSLSSTSVPITRKTLSSSKPLASKVSSSSSAEASSQSADSSSPWYSTAPKPLAATIERNIAPTPKIEKKTTRVKESAVKSAIKSVASIKSDSSSSSISAKHAFGAKKLLLAFGCAALVVGIIGYAVSSNTPDISVRVAAMQTGIDAAYPTYIPRGYSLSGIVSEDKKITMTFNASGENSFVLSEEKSSWDNETLEASYAKATWGANYISVREQGITIFISGSDAAWINGNILYKIDASSNNLTKKQIKSIATSL